MKHYLLPVLLGLFAIGGSAILPAQTPPSNSLAGRVDVLNPANVIGGIQTPPPVGTIVPKSTAGTLPVNFTLRPDGVYTLARPGGVPTQFRISTTEMIRKFSTINPETDFIKIVPFETPATDANDAVTKLVLEQIRSKVQHELILYGQGINGPQTKFALTRRVMAMVPRTVNVSALSSQVRALKAIRPSYNPDRVIFSFSGPADAIRGAEALLAANVGVAFAFPMVAHNNLEFRFRPNDPYYPPQAAGGIHPLGCWHCDNPLTGIDIGAEAAWDLSLGNLVRVSLVDDGMQTLHTDLRANAFSGYNLLSNSRVTYGTDPISGRFLGGHGTGMAGLIAAKFNNRGGTAGVAPNARVSPLVISTGIEVVLPSGEVTRGVDVPFLEEDIVASAVAFNRWPDVTCNAWGQIDNYDQMPQEWKDAIVDASRRSRGGRGVIYVSAAGNNANTIWQDDANYDQMNIPPLSVAVGSLTFLGAVPPYSEPGAALTCTAPSGVLGTSQTGAPPGLTTTDRDNTYRQDFGYTSGAASIVSGTAALMTRAKFTLGWRDFQEIVHKTSRTYFPWPPPAILGWIAKDIAGEQWHFHHDQGSGQIDAAAGVALARSWRNLRPAFTRNYADEREITIPPGGSVTSKFFVVPNAPRIRVEHTMVRVTMIHPSPAGLGVTVSSPDGTTSILQAPTGPNSRPSTWEYKSVFNWGECSGGQWTVSIINPPGSPGGVLQTVTIQLNGGPAPRPVAPPTVTNEGDPTFVPAFHPTMTPPLGFDEMLPAYEICHQYDIWNYRVQATNCPLRYGADGLPQGLVVNSTTGLITGSPQGIDPPIAQPPGTPVFFNVILWAENELGRGQKLMRLRVYPAIPHAFIEPSNVAVATVGQPFFMRVNRREDTETLFGLGGPALVASPGRTPVLPPGLLPTFLDRIQFTETGLIYGTPTSAGEYHFSVRGSNYCGNHVLDFYISVMPEHKTLGEALDIPGQQFVVSGADSWFYEERDRFHQGDALTSPIFDQNPYEVTRREAMIETLVAGPVRVEFIWESDTKTFDSGKFRVDGNMLATISGVTPWEQEGFDIAAGNHTLSWAYSNFDSAEAAVDRLRVDRVRFLYSELATALDVPGMSVGSFGSTFFNPANPTVPFIPAQPRPWVTQTNQRVFGPSATRSGVIGNNESSSMEIYVPGPGSISFDWRVHTAPPSADAGDYLKVFIDNVEVSAISGISGWTNRTIDIVGAGEHTVKWTYSKDGANAPADYLWGSNGVPDLAPASPLLDGNGPDYIPGTADDIKDKGYVDHIVFTPVVPFLAEASSESLGISASAPAPAIAVRAGSFTANGELGGDEFTTTLEGDDVVYTYQIDAARADTKRTPQISADGIIWISTTATLVKEEGSLQTLEVRGSASSAAMNFFRLIPAE